MLRIPRMHGSWSIWLISVVFGFLTVKSFDALILLSVLLFLFSVEPAYDFISGGKIKKDLAIPLALVTTLAIVSLRSPAVLPFVAAYSFMLVVQIIFKNNTGAFTGIGSVIMTFPFPLITSYFSLGVNEILRALAFLILLVAYSFTLVLYRNKNLKLPALIFLSFLLAFTFSAALVYVVFLSISLLMFLIVKKISLKGVGKSLLTYQFASIFIYHSLFL